MACTITFSRLPSSRKACTNSIFGDGGTALVNPAFERYQFAQKEIKTRGIQIHHPHQLTLALTSRDDVPHPLRSYSPGERAKQLYECINEKDLVALDEIIMLNANCLTHEILLFFEQLTSNMGKNVRFNLNNVGEDENSAWVNWHLDEIPFTRGCSFYECSKDGERLVNRKAQVFVEWPIKPGGTVLILLKTITSLFDDFPEVSDNQSLMRHAFHAVFLKSPRAILQWAMRIYDMLLAPFISTLLANYINSWKFMAPTLGYALHMIISILKFFFK
ncbi:hypothetical protein ACJRO7_019676 [Eucalyptus globulus]|uniref:Uncharacterized protein n=1 Tax=Eucalyptus globulus TaxID=34317 RepID=A0ABD3KFQ4_EUCGL